MHDPAPEKKRRRRLRLPLSLALLPALAALLLFGGKGLGIYDGLGFMPAFFRNVANTGTGGVGDTTAAGDETDGRVPTRMTDTAAAEMTTTLSPAATATTSPSSSETRGTSETTAGTTAGPLVIRVQERTFHVNDEIMSLEALGRHLDLLEEGSTVRLLDDHAIKSAYEAVLELLDERRISYWEGIP
ncbi:MAG: hypothetical protein QM270_07155 [Bacillota bacterium]|nr:hypothetical protein [Bacillota bacterium]